jgi:hypothetical protein
MAADRERGGQGERAVTQLHCFISSCSLPRLQ